MSVPTSVDPNLMVAAIVTSKITQPFEGVGLMVLYLAKRMHCQLVGEDAPQVPMDLLEFILAPLSMTNAKYHLWRSGIPYTQWVSNELDYEEFNNTRLMPSLTLAICVLPFHSFPFFFRIALHNDVHTGYSCQDGPIAGAPIEPPHLPWSVYVFGPGSFDRERVVGRNTNVMGYHIPKGT